MQAGTDTASKNPREALSPSRRERWSLVVLSILVVAVLVSGLYGTALIEPDEGRTAEISREMYVSGDYVLPRFNGLPFLDKPLLYFAAAAASMRVLGVSAAAARFPALVFALGLALLAAWFAYHLFGRRAAWIAGIATATSPLLIGFSRIAIFDSVLSFFIVLALAAFYRAVECRAAEKGNGGVEDGRFGPRAWNLVAWGAIGLGVLTKGPVALAVPLLVAASYAVWRKASKAVWFPLGPLLMLAMVVPWLAAVHAREPGFLRYAFVVETWQRLTTDEMNRQGPIWYFLPYLIGGAFPWSLVALAGWWRSREAHKASGTKTSADKTSADKTSADKTRGATRTMQQRAPWVFLGLWLILPLVLFSLSHSKRPQYILPLIPCLAIVVGGIWTRAASSPDTHRPPGTRLAASAYVLAGAILVAAALLLDPSALGVKLGAVSVVRWAATALGIVSLGGGLLSWRMKSWSTALIALCLPVLSIPVLTSSVMSIVSEQRSSRELAGILESHGGDEAEIILLESFPLSLPFYLQRTLVFASTDAETVRSGYVKRAFDELLARDGSSLRSRSWWHDTATSCSSGSLFVLSAKHRNDVSVVEGVGRAFLGGSRRFVVYGDCAKEGS